jgi:hypothetical protein
MHSKYLIHDATRFRMVNVTEHSIEWGFKHKIGNQWRGDIIKKYQPQYLVRVKHKA